jgi:hypothetical protein
VKINLVKADSKDMSEDRRYSINSRKGLELVSNISGSESTLKRKKMKSFATFLP